MNHNKPNNMFLMTPKQRIKRYFAQMKLRRDIHSWSQCFYTDGIDDKLQMICDLVCWLHYIILYEYNLQMFSSYVITILPHGYFLITGWWLLTNKWLLSRNCSKVILSFTMLANVLNKYYIRWKPQLFERLEFSMLTSHAKLSVGLTKRIKLFKIWYWLEV